MSRRVSKLPVDHRPPPQHTCSVCAQVAAWGPTWQWFGSHKDLDDGRPILKICSEACHDQLKAQGGAPRVLARLQREAAA